MWPAGQFPGRVRLRTGHPALHRKELESFSFNAGRNAGFHPSFDENDGERLLRFAGRQVKPLGSAGQVIVVVNCRRQDYPSVSVDWPWGFRESTVRDLGPRDFEVTVIEDCCADFAPALRGMRFGFARVGRAAGLWRHGDRAAEPGNWSRVKQAPVGPPTSVEPESGARPSSDRKPPAD